MYKLVLDENAPQPLQSRISRQSEVSSRAPGLQRQPPGGSARAYWIRQTLVFHPSCQILEQVPENTRAASNAATFKKCITNDF